jgi:nitroimidazol reductase NimA-like FMN-containing flavoprotein (pyridoxamine 5'-phosphate oxidase superfamily)
MLGSLSTSDIEDLLYQCNLGRIGCSHNGKTYIVPVNYVYDGRSVIAHSVEGLKIRMMRSNPSVCFEVDEVQNNKNWKSVIAQGTYQEIIGERERYDAMKQFVDRMLKLKVSTTAHGSVKPVIYRIILTEKTGRYEKE